jgi:hypothetical protein
MPGPHRHARPRPRLQSLATLSAAAILATAACGTTAPTATPLPTAPPTTVLPTGSPRPPGEVYAEIRDQVEAIRGLQPTAEVDPVTIDEEQLRANLESEFDKQNSGGDLEFTEATLIALGLLPAGSSIRKLTLDLQAGQVAGYYSPDRNELFVVSRSGRLGPAEEVTYAHEFTHQLQDQHFDLGKLGLDAANQSDRALAQLALIEGDAVSVQTAWTAANLTAQELGELFAASLDPKAIEALRSAPAYLRETVLFPYQDGLNFVNRLIASGGYDAVDAAFANPPTSTEQILHPTTSSRRDTPIEVELPGDLAKTMGAGWSEIEQDTLGELILRIWLAQNGVPTTIAVAAAAGWGGDRLALLRGPSGEPTVGFRTEWDTADDADEFAAAAGTALASLGGSHRVIHADGSRTIVLALGDADDRLARALSRG